MPLYAIGGARPNLPADSWIAPSADLIGGVRVGREVGIWFGAVIRADNTPIVIGDRTNVQDGCILHSDPGMPLTIGTDCTIGHHAILHGCTIGDRVLVGMGATILNGAMIGDECLIGAGALVTEGKIFPARSLIVGVPAVVKRTLDDTAVATLRASAASYVEKQRKFARSLVRVEA